MNSGSNSIPSFIVKTCKGREQYIAYLNEHIPNLIESYDSFIDTGLNDTAYQNFQNGLLLAGDNATVQLEDDIILCTDFYSKILFEIKCRPNDVIQFFSMRNADIEVGSRYEPGYNFMMGQCFYLPAGMAKELYNYSLHFNKERKEKNSPLDTCVAHFLKWKRTKYWIVVPNLVDHLPGVSAIDKRRSSKRKSLTFRYE